MDRIIFGDNQFFGINHMSEDKAQEQSERFRELSSIIRVIDDAYACGIRGFMFNTHSRVQEICDYLRGNASRYPDIHLYPSLPYGHKYANAVAEKGILGALNQFVFSRNSVGQIAQTMYRGGKGLITRDMFEVMKILVDLELKIFRGLETKAIFLQNIVTDLLLGARAGEFFVEFCNYVRKRYGVEPAFNTMNMPMLVDYLLECGIENPVVCSSINKCGYLMSPHREAYEDALRSNGARFQPFAMSVLASGAIHPREAITYVATLPNVRSIVFGASSRNNIEKTCGLIREFWADA